MRRRTAAILILVAWVGALGWLGAREWSRRGVLNLTGRQVVSPGAGYYRIALGDSMVGYALLQVDTLGKTDTSPALVLLQRRMMIAAGDAPRQQRYEVTTSAWLTTDLRLWRAETQRGDPSGVVRYTSRVDHDTLRTLIQVGADTFRTSVALDTVPVPVEALPLYLATYGRPHPGQAIALPTIDLATLARRRVTWTATAESTFTVPDSVEKVSGGGYRTVTTDTVHAWRVSATDRTVQVHQWIDENGFPLRSWTGGGLTFEREAFEPALEGFQRMTDSLTGHSRLAIPATADPRDLRNRDPAFRTLLLTGAEYPTLEATGPTQSITGDTLSTYEPNSWRGQQAFRPLAPLPMQDPRFATELRDEPRLELTDTALRARAAAIRGATTNAREAAIALQVWVRTNVTVADPGAAPGGRPAGTILATRAGTPEEIAGLTVALARAMGLPARLAGGLLLTPGGARLHTWTELFIGDWIPVDPTQGGLTASPAHIRLVAGGSGAWTDLLPLAGALVGTGTQPVELR